MTTGIPKHLEHLWKRGRGQRLIWEDVVGHGAGPDVPEQAHASMNKQPAVPGLPVALMLPRRSVL